MRRLVLLVLLVLALSAGSGAARSQSATVGVYPSGTTFSASGGAPAHPASSVSLAMPIGGVDDATLLVRGAQNVSIVSPAIAPPLELKLFFAHYVSVDGKAVPDALMPWDGSQRATEHTNQPLWLQVTVPYGTPSGNYSGSLLVVADGTRTPVPISVTVSAVTLPQQNQVAGSLLTAFNFSPQSYANKAAELYGVSPDSTLPGLFSFLASYRLSPNSWGYGNPKVGLRLHERPALVARQDGADDHRGRPARAVRLDVDPDLEQPLEPEHVRRRPVAVQAADLVLVPQVRARLLGEPRLARRVSVPVRNGRARGDAVQDRPAQQAKVTHSCFPGSHVLVTGKPTAQNHFLWNGGKDDVDAWVVLASRYYGKYTNPSSRAAASPMPGGSCR